MTGTVLHAPPGHLVISEIFGPTIQGEGTSLGRRTMFVRLSGCHMSCLYCDTAYTWDSTRFNLDDFRKILPVSDVAERVFAGGAGMAVITGGEPLRQQSAVADLAGRLRAGKVRVEVETSGSIAPTAAVVSVVDQFNVSPKLAASGMTERRRRRDPAVNALLATGKAVWKFVAVGVEDLDEIAEWEARFGLAPIWVMPEGTDADTILRRSRELADPVIARGWNLTPRLHVLLWGDERGR
jgi:7-carboxy-7-deazaguanine synthase